MMFARQISEAAAIRGRTIVKKKERKQAAIFFFATRGKGAVG